jgi:hypothetical protein
MRRNKHQNFKRNGFLIRRCISARMCSFWSYQIARRALGGSPEENGAQHSSQVAFDVLVSGGIAGIVTWASIFPLGRHAPDHQAWSYLADGRRCRRRKDKGADTGSRRALSILVRVAGARSTNEGRRLIRLKSGTSAEARCVLSRSGHLQRKSVHSERGSIRSL